VKGSSTVFVTLVDHQVVESTSQAGYQGDQQYDNGGFQQWLSPLATLCSINHALALSVTALRRWGGERGSPI
jgi:hypothetical protein